MAMAAHMSKMSEDSIYREELHKGRLYKVSGRLYLCVRVVTL